MLGLFTFRAAHVHRSAAALRFHLSRSVTWKITPVFLWAASFCDYLLACPDIVIANNGLEKTTSVIGGIQLRPFIHWGRLNAKCVVYHMHKGTYKHLSTFPLLRFSHTHPLLSLTQQGQHFVPNVIFQPISGIIVFLVFKPPLSLTGLGMEMNVELSSHWESTCSFQPTHYTKQSNHVPTFHYLVLVLNGSYGEEEIKSACA